MNELYFENDNEAEKRYGKYKSFDPFPNIPPALLNSADISDYVRMTGMVRPFYATSEKLKSASYEVDFWGEIHFWDDDRVKRVTPLTKCKNFTLKSNSIAFIFLKTNFRLPDYIALRFNLRIKHVHRGLLLGTGPLIDPGFKGRLLIPLHNLTSNDYELVAGEGLIWVEFTKLSPNKVWDYNYRPSTRLGQYFPFRDDKTCKDPSYYFDRATQGNSIRSSIPDTFLDTRKRAESAEQYAINSAQAAEGSKKAADDSKAHVDTLMLRLASFGALGVVIALVAFVALALQASSLVNDTNSYINGTQKEFGMMSKSQKDIEEKVKYLESDIKILREIIEKSIMPPTSSPVNP